MKQNEWYTKLTDFGNFKRVTYIQIASLIDGGEIVRDMYWIDLFSNGRFDLTIREKDECSETEIQDKYELCEVRHLIYFIKLIFEVKKIEGR